MRCLCSALRVLGSSLTQMLKDRQRQSQVTLMCFGTEERRGPLEVYLKASDCDQSVSEEPSLLLAADLLPEPDSESQSDLPTSLLCQGVF